MKILAIPGSIREQSFNAALLHAMANLAPTDMQVHLFHGLAEIPIFIPETEDSELPANVLDLINQMREADAVIFCAPEYAHGVSGVIKNLLDWLVASDAIVLKPVSVCTVSTSGLGGVRSFSSLVQILSAMNSHIVIDASFCVPYAKSKFDEQLNLIDEITIKKVELSLSALQQVLMKNNGA